MKKENPNIKNEQHKDIEKVSLWREIPVLAYCFFIIGTVSTVIVALAAFGILSKFGFTIFEDFEQGNFIAEGMSLLIEATLLGVLLGIVLPRYLERNRQKNETQLWKPMADFAEGQLVKIATDLIELDIVDGTKGNGWYFRDNMNVDNYDFESAENISKIDANLDKLANLSCGPSTPQFRSYALKLKTLVQPLQEAIRILTTQRRNRFVQEWDMFGLIVHPKDSESKTWSVSVAEILTVLRLHPTEGPVEKIENIRRYYNHAESDLDPDEWQVRTLRYMSALHCLFHNHRVVLRYIQSEFGASLEDYTAATLERALTADFTRGNLIMKFDKSDFVR